MSRTEPAVSVVIETINLPPGDSHGLDSTLAGLARQTIASEIEVIVVADPKVHPDLRQHVASTPLAVSVIDAPGLGYYAQKMAGAQHAQGEIVAFTDSDCIPVDTWAEAILEAFAGGDNRLGAVQGPIASDGSILGDAFTATLWAGLQTRTTRRTTWIGGSNCAFRRAELLVQPFDDAPLFHGPDVRMAQHVVASGRYILLHPAARVRHGRVPGFMPFLARGFYWGYCFALLCLGRDSSPRYAALFRRVGPLAPLALGPVKAFVDLRELLLRRSDLGVPARRLLPVAAVLLLNAVPVGLGAVRGLMKLPPPTAATSSNAHMAELARLSGSRAKEG